MCACDVRLRCRVCRTPVCPRRMCVAHACVWRTPVFAPCVAHVCMCLAYGLYRVCLP
jgi:hypothetical protein